MVQGSKSIGQVQELRLYDKLLATTDTEVLLAVPREARMEEVLLHSLDSIQGWRMFEGQEQGPRHQEGVGVLALADHKAKQA